MTLHELTEKLGDTSSIYKYPNTRKIKLAGVKKEEIKLFLEDDEFLVLKLDLSKNPDKDYIERTNRLVHGKEYYIEPWSNVEAHYSEGILTIQKKKSVREIEIK